MAQQGSKPITVKISSAANALEEIGRAIDKALNQEESNVNKQFRDELKLQAKLGTLEDQLNLAGSALNGPPVGITIPTVAQLYVPLRTILQQPTFYPADANPFTGATAPSAVDTDAKGTKSTFTNKTNVGVLNFYVQQLIFNGLDPQFTSLLANYKDSKDAALEEEVVSYLQKTITGIIQRTITQKKLSQDAASLKGPSSAVSADLKDMLDEGSNPGVTAKISQTENQYVDQLNGFSSTIFPPPGGRDFLTNLENLIMASISSQVSTKLNATGNTTDTTNTLKAVQNSTDLIRSGVDNALFNQLSGLGIQGALLSDALDNETSTGIKQNLTSLLNFLDDYKKDMSNLNTTAMTEAQSVLSSKSAVETFKEAWDVAQDALNANEETLQTGDANYATLNAMLNGKNNTNRKYLTSLLYDNTAAPPGGPMILDNAESLSTQVTAEVAGLLFMANTTLNKQTALNQVTAMDKTISDQFNDDVTNLKTAFQNYASALSSFLKTNQEYHEKEAIADAGMTVESNINQIDTASANLNPTFS